MQHLAAIVSYLQMLYINFERDSYLVTIKHTLTNLHSVNSDLLSSHN